MVRMCVTKMGSNPATSKKISQKFEAERWWMGAVCMQNGVPQQLSKTTWFWQIPTANRWTYALSEHFSEEKPSFFDKPAPKSNRSDRTHRLVHSSPSCMFHASLYTIQSKKFCGDFHFLVTSYLLCNEMMSSCLRLSSFFLGLDTIIT